MPLLIKNIKGLAGVREDHGLNAAGNEIASVRIIEDAYLIARHGIISDYGKMSDLHKVMNVNYPDDFKVIDASGCFVFPSFCDPHTHIVYAGSREDEFAYRLRGLSYEEIARRGGGILNSAKKLHAASEEDLYMESAIRIREIISFGTGAVEIKSGYGLTTGDELKMLRVIKRIRENFPLEIRSTFLGAHAIPEEFLNDREQYVGMIINEMIPAVAAEDLADFIDVFCDDGFFTVEETERILMAGLKYGLLPKLHASEIANTGGVQAGVKYNAISVDHLERAGNEEIKCLAGNDTVPTLLPGSSLFLGLPDPPARKMIDAGLPVAMASDYNPGSSPSGNMKLIMSLGCMKLKMTPEEAFNAVTLNAACAMGISETHGSVTRGKAANLIVTKEMPSFSFFPYAYGSNLVDKVILKGEIYSPSMKDQTECYGD
jgi:imidazolonepropionase